MFGHVHWQEHLVAHRHRVRLNFEKELMNILGKHARRDYEVDSLGGEVVSSDRASRNSPLEILFGNFTKLITVFV